MPFLNIKHQQGKQVFIGETEFINPDDEKDIVKLRIYLASPKFTDKLTEDYAQHGDTFVSDLKTYIQQYDRKVLRNLVTAN